MAMYLNQCITGFFIMIKTKCIKDPIETSDGIRISVMSSHTIDGIISDTEITGRMY